MNQLNESKQINECNNKDINILDYEKTNTYISLLVDIRFKLLAIVPTVSGAAIALVSANESNLKAALVLGFLGLFVTLGIIFYELRNSQLYDAAIYRAKCLEIKLDMPRYLPEKCTPEIKVGGLFNERPLRPKLFGFLPIWHDRGLALIYSATLAGWTYLINYSFFSIISIPPIKGFRLSILLAFIIGMIFLIEFHRIEKESQKCMKKIKYEDGEM